MKRIFVPTVSGSDWQRLLSKPKLHWKKGYSAMTAAACWEDSQPELPAEIISLLESAEDASLTNLKLLLAIPEWEVELPGGDRPSQTDVLAITKNNNGLVVLCVEAKVEEPFGPTLADKKAGASTGQIDRIEYLEKELGRTSPFPDHIRYQLLHRTVSALLTARDLSAPVGVMLVHSFSQASAWYEDFEAFCKELDGEPLSDNLWQVPGHNKPRLILGWCKGNPAYLETALPSAL